MLKNQLDLKDIANNVNQIMLINILENNLAIR